MTFDEYNNKISEYGEELRNLYGDKWDKFYEEVSKFQQVYMENVLDEYQKKIDCKAKEHIFDLMCYAVRMSETGNSIVYVETKEIADEIDNIIWKEIGDYLLDCEIYEEDNRWVIDCMFCGSYVPYWDGWCEE